jgi:hypothetical protein
MVQTIKEFFANPVLFLWNSFADWIIGIIKTPIANWAASNLNTTFEMMGFSSGASTMLANHPNTFDGFSMFGQNIVFNIGGTNVYTYIQTISVTVIIPLAVALLIILSVHELATGVIGSNLKEFEPTVFIKWGAKLFMGVFILDNAFEIVDLLFSIGPMLVNMAGATVPDLTVTTTVTGADFSNLGFWATVLMWLISLVVLACAFMIHFLIVQFLLLRLFEIFLLVSVAPIPLATFSNSEFSRTGQGFLKILLTYGLQAFLIILVMSIFTGILSNIIPDSGGISFGRLVPIVLIMMVMLSFIKNSKAIIQQVIN